MMSGTLVWAVALWLLTSSSSSLVMAQQQQQQQAIEDCPTCTCDVNNSKPFAGISINVLGRSFGHEYFSTLVQEWEAMTGAQVNIPVLATTGTELSEWTYKDLSTSANYFDGYLATNQGVPTLAAEDDWLLPLDALVKESTTLDWTGIHPLFRQYLCLYNSTIYTLPFDGDQFLLYYRRDLQERDGWKTPTTWQELIDVAEQYVDQDLNGDGDATNDYAICQPNQGDFAFYSLYAPLLSLLQTHPATHAEVYNQVYPTRHGVFFDLQEQGLEPLIDNAAMRRVLPLMKRMYELGKSEPIDLCCDTKESNPNSTAQTGHGLYMEGRCAFYYSFPSVGTNSVVEKYYEATNTTHYPFQHGKMGTAPLPGWTEFLDRDTDLLQPCTPEHCPTSKPIGDFQKYLNQASWFANGGMGSVINKNVAPEKQLAAFDLFAYVSRNLETTAAGVPYNPFRDPDHFQLDEYVQAGWDTEDARLYLEAVRAGLENHNAAIDLRLPYVLQGREEDQRGFFRAYIAWFQEYNFGTKTLDEVIAGLDAEIREWLRLHDTSLSSAESPWTGAMEMIYRQSMSLPLRPKPVDHQYHSIKRVRWLGWALGAVVVVTSLGFLVWIHVNRCTRLVRASQPLFLGMICVGTMVMGATLFPLGVDDTITTMEGTNIACMAAPWLFACGFSIAFSALFTKQWRINKIFHNPRFKRIKVTEKDVIPPFVFMFTCNIAFLLSWTLLDPLKWEHVTVDDLNSYGQCSPEGNGKLATIFVSLLAGVNLLALALSNIQAYRARMIGDEFSETQYIALAMFSSLEVVIFTLPVFFLVKDSPSARYFVLTAITFVICMSMLLLIFVPKVILVRKGADSSASSVSTKRSSGTRSTWLRKVNKRQSTGDLGIKITTVTGTTIGEHNLQVDKWKLEEYNEKLVKLKSLLSSSGLDASKFFNDAGIEVEVDEDGSCSIRPFSIRQSSTVRFATPADPLTHGKIQEEDKAHDETVNLSETEQDVNALQTRHEAPLSDIPSIGEAQSSSVGAGSFESSASKEKRDASPSNSHLNMDDDDSKEDEDASPSNFQVNKDDEVSFFSDNVSRSGD